MTPYMTFVPPRIKDHDRSLLETVMPYRWENLAGGLRWYRFTSDVYDDARLGRVRDIEIFGDVGKVVRQMAESKQRTGRCTPVTKSLLLHGERGIGKSLYIELLAVTFLAERHTAVGYTDEDGGFVTLIDETRQPLLVNPDDEDLAALVHTAIAKESRDADEIQVYNFGLSENNIAVVSAFVNNVHRATTLTPRRVFIASELDNIKRNQAGPIKVGLERNKMPDGVLVLADTNDYAACERNLDAGIERFHAVAVAPWRHAELAQLARNLLEEQLCAKVDTSTFQSPYEIYELLAEQADGGVRRLIDRIDGLRSLGRRITSGDVIEAHTAADPEAIKGNVRWYLRLAPGDVPGFAAKQAMRRASLFSFMRDLHVHVLHKAPRVAEHPDAAYAFAQLFSLCRDNVHDEWMMWGTATPFLVAVARLLGETKAAR